MASFALEIIGRPVHDVAGEALGNVVDLRIAEGTGALSHIIVAPLENINTEQLRGLPPIASLRSPSTSSNRSPRWSVFTNDG